MAITLKTITMKQLIEFAKETGIMLCVITFIITCVGSISTGDVVFIVAAIITLLAVGYEITRYLKKQ
jgi:hypothetical protein